MKIACFTFFALLFTSTAFSQVDTIKSYTTARVKGESPNIDGRLDDEAWNQVPWGGGDFIEVNPDAGAAPTVQTKFKILYDSKNLYIAFKNLDPDPSKIVSRMSRRDGFEGDWVEINIDSYFDKRTAFSFTSSVSGVKGDEYVSNNGDNWDASWDPIWYLQTSIDEEGWIAEVKIPLSQLRFADQPELTWGFQITRRFFRNQERSLWKYIPPNSPGWVHLFGELRGIKGIKPQKQLEVQPYVVAKTETFEKEEGNPFMTGTSSGVAVGLDAKIGLTSDVTLDLTVNPDFGQVEADPSQVNLTAFELFFQEQRPFFIEGNNTLNFPVNNFGSNNLFYSRRVGRQPQGSVNIDATEFAKANSRSTILGAAKLTGKNKNGFSWGILESVTDLERVEIDSAGERRKQTVEPLTNYLVGRVQQDINKGNTIIGGMLTATNRDIQDTRLNWLHDNAYSGGVDFEHNWKDRMYYVSTKALFSHVRGSTEAITNTQRSSERFFQRPDNNHARVDTTRRTLTGTGGTVVAGKKSGNIVFDVGLTWSSPELELNDIGFLAQTDQFKQWAWLQYRIVTPKGIFRSQRYNVNQSENFDFDFKSTSRNYNINTHFEFTNLWAFSTGASYETHSVSNADLRGGPAMHYPGSSYYWFWASTDRRKKFSVNVNPEWQWGNNNYIRSSYLELNFQYTPINALSISVSPSISHSVNQLQYVATGNANGEDRFIMGEIDQSVARVSLRVTYMLTPNLSFQYWGQPFGASGKYSNFKHVTDANASEYTQRFTTIPASLADGNYNVDENSDGNTDYSFDQPNFNYGQFRSNMVMRWEYIPGSTFFLVWTQERNGAFYDEGGPVHQRYNFDFPQKPHNIFLVKFTYRFVL
jgi:hypothetical protein